MSDSEHNSVTEAWGEGATPSSAVEPEACPAEIGRYRVQSLLGAGGFGRVFLARDVQLDRLVAVKVPHAKLLINQQDAQPYLDEARTVAGLDHPHIVPVYNVESTDEIPCFIVSKYIEGQNLAAAVRQSQFSYAQAAELVATVADALHYAHRRSLVHRDVKPGNILIDTSGTPFLVDFGVALREKDAGTGPKFAGTPAYMSPEQARGEGHRVDGRSDIFSLSVVFYELLVGRRPFHAKQETELLEQVTTFEPRPPRQFDDTIPKELERICLKALSKRAMERYTTAKDMADDLRYFLEQDEAVTKAPSSKTAVEGAPSALPTPASSGTVEGGNTDVQPATPTSSQSSDSRPLKIVPKGLRSFDSHDADFFLELLPGPRDRDGLPDSIRFWKTRIEEQTADDTFSTGLIYGPSGCGKSSFVKAGLLPRLDDEVIPVYVECNGEETERRLLKTLRRWCPALPTDLGLTDTIAALRRGQGLPVGKKVLIVLDQFEQWLHAHAQVENTELVRAVRQCDGGRAQCVVMVRDDFWMAATRFVRELEVQLIEGKNSAAVDLFPVSHARKVLAAFGRAFGDLPQNAGALTKEHKSFLDRACQDLAQDDKVICVRLALFAEMMKGRPWTPATLKRIGGTSGIGVTFLDETFSSATAPPEHRLHQCAARSVLDALLPDAGTDIKVHLLPYDELLARSGYAQSSRDIDDLLRILDTELRLITPTEPEAAEMGTDSVVNRDPSQKYYQLTHDYLIHSLREWLTRKQRETRKGRAELTLGDRAGTWQARPENRFLPSLWEFLNIRALTDRDSWNERQQSMMRTAGRYYGLRCLAWIVFAGVLAFAGLTIRQSVIRHQQEIRASDLVDILVVARISRIPDLVGEMRANRDWVDAELRRRAKETTDPETSLRIALGLLPAVDRKQTDYLRSRMLSASVEEFPVLRNALRPHDPHADDFLWCLLEDPSADSGQRFRAACAIVSYTSGMKQYADEDERWEGVASFVAEQLVSVMPSQISEWRNFLWPLKRELQPALENIYRDSEASPQQRLLATDTLAAFAADEPESLFGLLADADHQQFSVVFAALSAHEDEAVQLCAAELNRTSADLETEAEQIRAGRRRANAAIALMKLGSPASVWPVWKAAPDPTARSFLIHWAEQRGVPANVLIERAAIESDATARSALLLAIGSYPLEDVPEQARSELEQALSDLYEHHEDGALRAAAGWLLRHWGQEDKLNEITTLLKTEKSRKLPTTHRGWFVNSDGVTMVAIDGGEFLMGSPRSEVNRDGDEGQHPRSIDRRFAMAATLVTKGQYRRFQAANPDVSQPYADGYSRTADSPMIGPDWFEAAWYCNWLSEQDGLAEEEWCYLPNEAGKYSQGMRPAEDFLTRSGYRLPTEAEWEFACRAGTVTSFSFGASKVLLDHYGWYLLNADDHTWPVGRLKPNDFGLFDMHGHVWEWVHDNYYGYEGSADGSPLPENQDLSEITNQQIRLNRSGSFQQLPRQARSASRGGSQAASNVLTFGFRVARTIPR
jgi:serine/threonine protein kinase/formylglycine-generating enzyme required for sulfatase activity